MLIFFIVMTIAVQNQLLQARIEQHGVKAAEIASIINNEVSLAAQVNKGYERTFFIPSNINGYPYDISHSPDGYDLVIELLGRQYVYFLDGDANNICNLKAGEFAIVRNYHVTCT